MSDTETTELIRLAGQTLRLLKFDYTYASGPKEGQVATEIVGPCKIDFPMFWGDNFNYPKGEGTRQFYISNMENVEILEQTFTPRWPIEV